MLWRLTRIKHIEALLFFQSCPMDDGKRNKLTYFDLEGTAIVKKILDRLPLYLYNHFSTQASVLWAKRFSKEEIEYG
jgi:hypothetical protein